MARKKRAEWPPLPAAAEFDEEERELAASLTGGQRPRNVVTLTPNSRVAKGRGVSSAIKPTPGSAAQGRKENVKNAAFLEAAALFAKAEGGALETPVDRG